MGGPSDNDIDQVLATLNDAENQPVLVHCHKGADRTGVVIAIYRITHDGWTSEQAKAEANRYGMKPWQLGMKNYIDDYYQRQAKQKQPATR
ncbi:MAG: tyrosine-protein phosphatase [Pyrinomonadaceae bacterium]